MAVTIKDVAKLAGVSPSTVSRTCTNSLLISEKTQLKVRQAMEELGYIPPAAGFESAAEPAKNNILGVILPPDDNMQDNNTIFLEILRGITLYANEKGIMITLLSGKDEDSLLHSIKTQLDRKMIPHFIVLFSRENNQTTRLLREHQVPYTMVGTSFSGKSQVVCVDNDNLAAAEEATNYLIDKGHTRIAYVGKEADEMYSKARKNGYILALSNHGLSLEPSYMITGPLNGEYCDQKIRDLLSVPTQDRPTALVTSDDLYMLKVLQVARELSIGIPEDLSIISFNNSIMARMNIPAITSIDVNPLALGMEAASQAISQLSGLLATSSRILVPHHLIERNSVRDQNA